MLPPNGTLPKGTTRIPAHTLSVGDLVFLETAASGDPVRSLILDIQGQRFRVMNRLNPDPYEVLLPDSKMVWALRIGPRKPRLPAEDPPPYSREPSYSPPPPSEVDYSSYWNWDPMDSRAKQEYYRVENEDWRRLLNWFEERGKSHAKKKRRKVKPKSSTLALYQALNIRAGVTLKELKSAYKKAAFNWHPDRCSDPKAESKFKEVTAAYKALLSLIESKDSDE